MIRYSRLFAEVEEAVDRHRPRWKRKAEKRTELFARLGRYVESETVAGKERKLSEFWGEVKKVFIDFQYGKCVYCEMPIENGKNTEIQWDLEHFRPKASVRAWPATPDAYPFPTGDPMPEGYYLLAYHLGNYAAACKTCNSPYKSDYFPIAGPRVLHGATPEAHSSEQPFLIYPLGENADDPQDHIAFDGVVATARNNSRRGRVMIDFFDLNREGLQAARARWLRISVWSNLRLALQGDTDSEAIMEWLLSHAAPHTNCTRCFVELCRSDIAEAQALLHRFAYLIEQHPRPQPV